MATENIESFTDQKLLKRKKFVLAIIGVCIGIFLVSLVLLIIQLSSGEIGSLSGLVPGLICPVFTLPMYSGLKKINAELKKRQG
jgi:hypothetical protein